MVYGAFAILFVVLLITTYGVFLFHEQYRMEARQSQSRTVSLEDYSSPYVSGEVTISTRPIFYQRHSEYVTVNGSFQFLSGTPMNVTITELRLTIMNVPDPDDFWDTVYFNGNFLTLYNSTGFSIYDAYEISIGSLGNHTLGFGIDFRFLIGGSYESNFLGQLDVLPIFVFPGVLWPDYWYFTLAVMIIVGCVLLIHAVLKWLEIID
ncbi:MAG: hypothetical protein ACFFAL_01315 [Promethearchaeota archaeon]